MVTVLLAWPAAAGREVKTRTSIDATRKRLANGMRKDPLSSLQVTVTLRWRIHPTSYPQRTGVFSAVPRGTGPVWFCNPGFHPGPGVSFSEPGRGRRTLGTLFCSRLQA